MNIENIKNKNCAKVKKIHSFNSLKPTRPPEIQKPFLTPNNHRKHEAVSQYNKVKIKKNQIPPWEISTTKYNPLHVNDVTNNQNKNYHLRENVIRKVKSDLNLKTSKNSILSDITYSASFLMINKDRSYDRKKDQTSEILTSTRLVEKDDRARVKSRKIKNKFSNKYVQNKIDSNSRKKSFTSLPRPKGNKPLSRRTNSLGEYHG